MSFMSKSLVALSLAAVIGGAAFWNTSAQASKTEAIEVTAPPALSTAKLYQTNRVIASVPGTPGVVRAFFDANPITDFVATTDAIPAIVGITYLSGSWPEVGAVRQVQLEGGYTVTERVLINQPDHFAYQIWDITAPAGRFIDHIKGEFRYVKNGPNTDVIWDYNVKPTVFVARPFIRRYLDNDFGPFMKAGMEGVTSAYRAR